MYFNTLQVSLNTRNENVKPYALQITQGILDILFLVFEFKIATSQHISRFLNKKDQDKYIYFKMRKMWEVGLLESFKVYPGSTYGMPVYYIVSKKGLKLLKQHKKYDERRIKTYPKAKPLLDWSPFFQDAQVVEVASMEAKNNSNNLKITFSKELTLTDDFRREHYLFTPSYIANYSVVTKTIPIYTEYERTLGSKNAILQKVEWYRRYKNQNTGEESLLRFIFQNEKMEEAFWMLMVLESTHSPNTIKIATTNTVLLDTPDQFLEPIYATEHSFKLKREWRLIGKIEERHKLFPFL